MKPNHSLGVIGLFCFGKEFIHEGKITIMNGGKNMLEEARKILSQKLGIVTKTEDWSGESILLDKEELDPFLVKEIDQLPEEVFTHQYICVSEDSKTEYFVYFLMDNVTQKLIVKGLVVNNTLVWSEKNNE